MATPHVAGAVGLLAQQHTDWRAADLKVAMMASAKPHPGNTAFEQGAGRVDAARAVAQTVVPVTASISFGTVRWPHHDDQPVSRQLTYRNHGTADVTLSLTGSLRGPDGQPASETALRLGDSSVTVPAGGSATVAVTADTSHDGPDGAYSGFVTATADGVSVICTLQVDKEPETYDVTVRHSTPAVSRRRTVSRR
jgi:hypothetical protein